jgi:hypothetical protein
MFLRRHRPTGLEELIFEIAILAAFIKLKEVPLHTIPLQGAFQKS